MTGSLKNKTILVTYGPTWVAIDQMRILSNRSSGQIGKMIIADLIKAGAKVTALEGQIAEPLKIPKARIRKFQFFDEFKTLFQQELKQKYDIVIHAAAVSDFAPVSKYRKKITSNQQLKLTLLPTPKLIKKVKSISSKSILVGFKLESAVSERALKSKALELIRANGCDLVVANSLTGGYTGFIFDRNGRRLAKSKNRKELSRKLIAAFKRPL